MKSIYRIWVLILAAVLVCASTGQPIQAQSSSNGGYALSWWSVDGGGGIAPAGSGYALSGSIAQPDAQTWAGSGYTLKGGFWPGGLGYPAELFLPAVRR